VLAAYGWVDVDSADTQEVNRRLLDLNLAMRGP
jgi:hypothetical protein